MSTPLNENSVAALVTPVPFGNVIVTILPTASAVVTVAWKSVVWRDELFRLTSCE